MHISSTACRMCSGATAYDEEDGDVSDRIVTCPPRSCMPFNCRGHELRRKGIHGCGVDTVNAPVGTVFTLNFTVTDKHVPPASATVQRLIRVISPCPAQKYCPDLQAPHDCGSSDCTVRAALLAQTPVPHAPPVIGISDAVPKSLVSNFNESSPVLQELVHSRGGVGPVQLAVQMATPCGVPTHVPIKLCGASDDMKGCMAFASDPQAMESGSGWRLRVAAAPSGNCTLPAIHAGACRACSATAASAGDCLPGQHTFLMDSVSPNGLHAANKVAVTLHVGALIVSGDVLARIDVLTEAADMMANARLELMLLETGSKLTSVLIAAQAILASALQVHANSCGFSAWAGQEALGAVQGNDGVLLGAAHTIESAALHRQSLDHGSSIVTVRNVHELVQHATAHVAMTCTACLQHSCK
jgi:hypothetical protein